MFTIKKYIKPTIEYVELKPEEGLAGKGSRDHGCAAGRFCAQPSWGNPNNPNPKK